VAFVSRWRRWRRGRSCRSRSACGFSSGGDYCDLRIFVFVCD
jgi:hypothetical protein